MHTQRLVWILCALLLPSILGQPNPTFRPSHGSGPAAEFLVQTTASVVTLLINTTPSTQAACYVWIDTTPAPVASVWVDDADDWDTAGVGNRCSVAVQKVVAGIRVNVIFTDIDKWQAQGQQTVYIQERPTGQLYRAGVWTVTTDEVPWLPPTDWIWELRWIFQFFPPSR